MLDASLKSWICYFLDQYVESESLNISSDLLWKTSKKLKLQNLQLKKSLLPNFLPVRLKAGFIGELEIELPISAIFGFSPAKIRISDVLIVLRPVSFDFTEEQEEIASLLDEKMQFLQQDLISRWQGPQVASCQVSQENEGYFGTDGWVGRTITKLIDNLQVEIRNCHFRMEGVWYPTGDELDDQHQHQHQHPQTQRPGDVNISTSPLSLKFAIGVSIGAMSAETTASDWTTNGYNEQQQRQQQQQQHKQQQPKHEDADNSTAGSTRNKLLVYKLVQAINLSAYIDPNALHLIHSSLHTKVLQATLGRLKEMGDGSNPVQWWQYEESFHRHRFVVAPMSVSLKLAMNTAPQHAQTNEPRYNATFELSKVVSCIDEEQLSVIMLVVDSYFRHDTWRNQVAVRQKVTEKCYWEAADLSKLTNQYLLCWKQVIASKKEALNELKKTKLWSELTALEQPLPPEMIVSLRNQGISEEIPAVSVTYTNWLQEMGDAFGIPLPEFSVRFPAGRTGLLLEIHRATKEVAIAFCGENSVAAQKRLVQPGLLLVKVNGKDIDEFCDVGEGNKGAAHIQDLIDAIQDEKLLTFRHPSVKKPQVTPKLLVSRVLFVSKELSVHLVRAQQRKALVALSSKRASLLIRGYGPDLFWYHGYELSVSDFYIQNTCYDRHVNYCIASSYSSGINVIDSLLDANDLPVALTIGINYLDGDHPDAVEEDVSTYGTKWYLAIGKAVIVFDEQKITRLLEELSAFSRAISSQYDDPHAPALSLQHGSAISSTTHPLVPPPSNSSIASTAPTAFSMEQAEERVAPMTSSYSYDVRVTHLQLFASAEMENKYAPQDILTSTRQDPSYRLLMKKIARQGDGLYAASDEWTKSVNALLVLQRYARGYIVRKSVNQNHNRRRQDSQSYDGDWAGWLYKRDDTLSFRRWNRFFCHLDRFGGFSVYKDGSAMTLLERFQVTDCTSIQVVSGLRGPFGDDLSKPCWCLELRLVLGQQHVFCSEDENEMETWRQSILHKMQLNSWRTNSNAIYTKSSSSSMMEAFHPVNPRRNLWREFSDVYHNMSGQLDHYYSSWMSFTLKNAELVLTVHSSTEPEKSALTISLAADLVHASDHRKKESHGVLHVGNAFLQPKAGKLTPVVVITNKTNQDRFLVLNLTYRGEDTPEGFFGIDSGAHVDLDITGWFLPMNVLEFIFEFVEVIDILWANPSATTAPQPRTNSRASVQQPPLSANSTTSHLQLQDLNESAWYHVTELSIHIRTPLLESYVEEENCVAKLSLEHSSFLYRADPRVECFALRLGPTALFVLTSEVALRLAQIDRVRVRYALRYQELSRKPLANRSIDISIGQVKFEADRRLELLFALLEALTQSDEEGTQEDEQDEPIHIVTDCNRPHALDRPRTFYESDLSGCDHTLRPSREPTERFQSMQLASLLADDHATGSRRMSRRRLPNSPGTESLFSSTASYNNMRGSMMGGTGPKKAVLLPLLRYQSYIMLLSDKTLHKQRDMYRVPLRIGKIHDQIMIRCESIICEVIKRSLSVIALDTYIPVMNYSLDDLKLRMLTHSEFTKDYKIDGSIEISARYYNTSLADWEPFIEPWRAYAEIGCEPDDRNPKERNTSVKLHAMKRLNFNFTEALVRVLCSVARNSGMQELIPYPQLQRKPSAIAADAEASKESGRVCVLNNLGVPIRLANLNTSHPGTLHVEIRDGWSYPSYSRFHDVRVDVMLLPWWHPREKQKLECLRHTFSLAYGGAQSGVAPKVRIEVSTRARNFQDYVFDSLTKQYVLIGEKDDDGLQQHPAFNSLPHMSSTRDLKKKHAASSKMKWASIGSAEINLAGSVMGVLGSPGEKVSRWYRLHDDRGNITGEIFVALKFDYNEESALENMLRANSAKTEVPAVTNGSYLLFDPLKIGGNVGRRRSNSVESHTKVNGLDDEAKDGRVVLSESLRESYVPPLALEVLLGDKARSLLCPLRRAGKFLIQGENVLAEVKVAQRDESRRVLLLSSPVQLKNDTLIDMEVWTRCMAEELDGENQHREMRQQFVDKQLEPLKAQSKISIPLDALYGDKKSSIVVQVARCMQTKVVDLSDISAGSSLLILEAQPDAPYGYCFYVTVSSFNRKVYREEQLELVTRANTSRDGESQAYATKHQICLHPYLVFENTLPIRVQYRVVSQNEASFEEIVLLSGTLSPGEEVRFVEYTTNALMYLRLADVESSWTRPISIKECVFRGHYNQRESSESMHRADRPTNFMASDAEVEFRSTPASSEMVFKNEQLEYKLFVARLDYSTTDNGSPRVVLYASLWIYNQSHVQKLLFRDSEDLQGSITSAPRLVTRDLMPRLMDCPSQAFELCTVYDREMTAWTERIHATVVGVQGPIVMKSNAKSVTKRRHEIGISIQRPPGQFHRTTKIIVTPRFVFINKTALTFELCQNHKGAGAMELRPSRDDEDPIPFDFSRSDGVIKRHLYLRVRHATARWSGPFDLEEEKDFPLRLDGTLRQISEIGEEGLNDHNSSRHFIKARANMERIRVHIASVGASIAVTLRVDDPPMYVIRNESSFDLIIHQVGCSDKSINIHANEFSPFAWDKPDGIRRISCRIRLPGSDTQVNDIPRMYDFANLDRDKVVEEFTFWLLGNRLLRISADLVVENSSRVLVFRDEHADKQPRYILEVKIIATRRRNHEQLPEDTSAMFVVETESDRCRTDIKMLKNRHVYRFDSDMTFSLRSRPRHVSLYFYENTEMATRLDSPASSIDFFEDMNEASDNLFPVSPVPNTGFDLMQSPAGSPSGHHQQAPNSMPRQPPSRLTRQSRKFRFKNEDELSVGDLAAQQLSGFENLQRVSSSESVPPPEQALAFVQIRLPKKAWHDDGNRKHPSIAWSYNNNDGARKAFGGTEGTWWDLVDSEGNVIGQVQVALKFRCSVRENVDPRSVFNVSMIIPSVGVSFLHNANSNLVEVAYLSMQRAYLLYSQAGTSSEVIFSLGNLQMDNQMESEVVLGAKVHKVKEGVSVRLRDRWRSCLNYRNRGVLHALNPQNQNVVSLRMLWNDACTAGSIMHFELIQLVVEEMEISTDEKFVVNLISVFQGLEMLTTQPTFDEMVSSSMVSYSTGTHRGPVTDGIYIEQLEIDSIRVKFSLELNGGRHIKTLGPSGRRLAVYLPESNVKDFRLYFTKLLFHHIYESHEVIVEKLTRHYQQQAVRIVLKGLHTVSVYANPIRVVYRLGHGFLEVVRMPARGLASGSPVELVSGTYLGVRSLAMNMISASYEIVAGGSGILAAVVAPMLPEHKRKAFQEDMVGFQRAVMQEVDAFDAEEERTMTKEIVRKPRVFDSNGVGLLTVYGPGSLPMEEQESIDQKAVIILQNWWRRFLLARACEQEALRLKPDLAPEHSRMGCIIL